MSVTAAHKLQLSYSDHRDSRRAGGGQQSAVFSVEHGCFPADLPASVSALKLSWHHISSSNVTLWP